MSQPQHQHAVDLLPLVLASTSPYRRELLARLQIPFSTAVPAVDETIKPGESAVELVQRLAHAKARAVTQQFPNALIIGSDQVALCDDIILGKPLNHRNACEQLTRLSGQLVTFYTGICLLNSANDQQQLDVVPFYVHFRELTSTMIERYVTKEKPYNCSGSFKSEGLGIALFRSLEGSDPTALVGLPLIRLTEMLHAAGRPVL